MFVRFSLGLVVALGVAGCSGQDGSTKIVDHPLALPPTPSSPNRTCSVQAGSRVDLRPTLGGRLYASGERTAFAGGLSVSAELAADLDAVASYWVAHNEITMLRIEGHSDAKNARSGQGQATVLARAVAEWLVSCRGVFRQKLVLVDCGAMKPRYDVATQQDVLDRVDIYVAAIRGTAYRGFDPTGGCQPVSLTDGEGRP